MEILVYPVKTGAGKFIVYEISGTISRTLISKSRDSITSWEKYAVYLKLVNKSDTYILAGVL